MHQFSVILKTCSCLCCFKGYYKFRCPAVGEGTAQCNKLWSYQEVRRLADLSVEEMQYFEEAMSLLAAAEYCEILTVSVFLLYLNVAFSYHAKCTF